MRTLLPALAVLSVVLVPVRGGATMLFERDPADPFTAGTLFSDAQQPREAATPFQLASDASVSQVTWWGDYFTLSSQPGPGSTAFQIQIFGDDGGAPAAALLGSADVTAVCVVESGPVTEFRFTAHLDASIDVPGGVPLWISIVDVDPARPTFAWRKSTEAGTSFSRASADFAWGATPGIASLELQGSTVPEPATSALFGLGLGALAVRHRRSTARALRDPRRAAP